jgi:type IV pilus assembly protein PilC
MNRSNADLSAFCAQLGMLLKAGISTTEAIAILEEDATAPREKALFHNIAQGLLETGSLKAALEGTGAFPAYLLSMVDLGEHTGRLDQVMTSLGDYYDREDSLSQALQQAVTYPCIMVVMLLAVLLLLITQVLPIFDQVFRQLGTEMTGFAGGLLAFGDLLRRHWAVLVLVVLLLVAVGIWLRKSHRGHALLTELLHRLRGTGRLLKKVSAYRFASGLSLTLRSGLTPEDSLRLTLGLLEPGPFRDRVETCLSKVHEGQPFDRVLADTGIFSGLYAPMAAIAARTGTMDEMLGTMAKRYEQELDDGLSRALSAIEPTLVVVLSLLVGGILLSVMLPLIRLLSAL